MTESLTSNLKFRNLQFDLGETEGTARTIHYLRLNIENFRQIFEAV